MSLKNFKDWRITSKITFTSMSSGILLIVLLFTYLLPLIENKIMEERLGTIRSIVEFSIGIIEQKNAQVKSGAITIKEAQKAAIEELSTLRYGKKEYVWIHDLTTPVPVMIMHPTSPALNSMVLGDQSFNKATSIGDAAGKVDQKFKNKNLFIAMNEVVKRSEVGTVKYEWNKATEDGGVTNELYPKMSYVKKFAPWGWVVGSGLYVDDVIASTVVMRRSIFAICIIFALLCISLSFFSERSISTAIDTFGKNLDDMSNGEVGIAEHMNVDLDGETGLLAKHLNRYVDRLKEKFEGINSRLLLKQIVELTNAQHATIFAMAKLAEQRDEDTGAHLERVREYCKLLAESIGKDHPYKSQVTQSFIKRIQHAAPLHDIGKVAIPDCVLLKPGKLDKDEFAIIKSHVVIGADNLQAVFNQYSKNAFIGMGIEIALYHHERWDGTGYPDKLIGINIPLSARIMALADVYDALRSDRCYRKGINHSDTLVMIKDESGKHFDPFLVDVFLEVECDFENIASAITV